MDRKEKMSGRMGMEKMMSDLSRLFQRREFKSKEEAEAYFKSLKGKEIPEAPPKTAVEFAQDIMYEAWEAEDKKERIKLAKEALSVSADCADAYNLLAEEDAETLEDATEYYIKGMEAGSRSLGEEVFQEHDGCLWAYTPARPYMRSRLGYMQCLWEAGSRDEAVAHAMETLRLNTNDNQGIRYVLAVHLADLKRYDELDELLNRGEYEDDSTAEWLYARTLVSFVKNGDAKNANDDLKAALKSNQYVPEYLTGKKTIPLFLPDSVTVHGEDEAFCYASIWLEAWRKVPGAIDWLKNKAGIKIFTKVGRNEPCPCGSGKKYKKCCGA